MIRVAIQHHKEKELCELVSHVTHKGEAYLWLRVIETSKSRFIPLSEALEVEVESQGVPIAFGPPELKESDGPFFKIYDFQEQRYLILFNGSVSWTDDIENASLLNQDMAKIAMHQLEAGADRQFLSMIECDFRGHKILKAEDF